MSLASSSRSFALPRILASSTSTASSFSSRSFSSSSSPSAPYRTSSGQEAILPVYSPNKLGGSKSTIPPFQFVDYRARQALPYPFASSAIVPFLPPLPAVREQTQQAPVGLDILGLVNHNLRLTQDPNSFWYMFDRSKNPKDAIRIGSVVQVTSWSSMAKDRTITFTGVLIGRRRRGAASSFDLRNVILRTGVEMRYMCSSPLLKEVKCLKPADSKPGNLKRAKRSKLYFYRSTEYDKLAPAVAALRAGRRGKVEAGTAFQ